MITEISIKNFRSISSATIKSGRITTFVGSNDAGKSNVLRALNLFFNGETGHGEPFDFVRDHNMFAAKRNKKAPEIDIKVTFELPRSYQRDDLPSEVELRKIWREEGEAERYRSLRYVGGIEIPPRSKIPALIDRVLYTYIPAIKDTDFFADLQGRLYDVLSSVAEEPLKNSASDFERQLQVQLGGLLDSLESVFLAKATMKLPENLREIFENLEISSNDVPLSRRGDGIKIRNIPMMLQFIAQKQDQILNRGGIRYTHIWGFEEPENNVEMSAAFKMAKDMFDLIEGNENFQLFVTTHSPIFYKMPAFDEGYVADVSTNFVEKSENDTVISNKKVEGVDISMGLMPILAPYLAEAKARFDELQENLRGVQELALLKRPTVFVEGPSDKRVLEKAWSLFGDATIQNVYFNDGGLVGYGSAHALSSRSLAWLLEMRHRAKKDALPAIAIFDADEEGKNAKRNLSENMRSIGINNADKFASILYPQNESLRDLSGKGFLLPADLESTYSDEFWLIAEKKGWLVTCSNVATRVKQELLQKVLAEGHGNPLDDLGGVSLLRVTKKFSDEGKDKSSKLIAKMSDEQAANILADLEPLVKKIVQTLRV